MSEIHIWIIVFLVHLLASNVLLPRITKKLNDITYIFILNTLSIILYIVCLYNIFNDVEAVKKTLDVMITSTPLLIAVIGFTLQNSIKNIIAGGLISSSKAFKMGDRITLRARELTGYVEELTLRHTIIRTYTNERVIIPNAILNEEVIINNNLTDKTASYPIILTIPSSNDLEKAVQCIESVLRSNNKIINEHIEVFCSDISVQGLVTLKTFIWTKNIEDSFLVSSQIRLEILKSLKDNDITLVQ